MKRIGVPAVTTATCSLLIASGIFISSFANAAGTGHVPAGPKVHAPAAATVGSAQAGLQLALADAKANLQQALAAAGNDKILKKEARAQYKAQVTAINKAIATTQN